MANRQELPPALTKGPFTTAQAAALGVPTRVLDGSRFRRLHRTVYALADLDVSIELRFDAVRLLVPDAVASHETAAILRSIPVPDPKRLHVTVDPAHNRPRLSGVQPHRAHIGDDRRLLRGRPVASVERTLCDLAAGGLDLIDLVIFGDAAVRHGWTTTRDLVTYAQNFRGRGCRSARQAADLVRARVDSPMETRLRLLIVLAGLPEPIPNRTVNDETGWVCTPDLCYPEYRIAIEYDGDHHRTDRRQWRQDKARARRLRDLDWELLECTANDVLRTPHATLSWVHERLLRASHPATPAVLGDAWRAHWT